MLFKFPKFETERLDALYRTQILDSPPEKQFDHITALLAEITGCPTALISLVDSKRQWFKSTYNFPVTETTREGSLCTHAILHNEFFQIKNLETDNLFCKHPAFLQNQIRFYAGAMINVNGHNLGTVCVLDTKPRELNSLQIESLKTFALTISHLIQGRQYSIEKTNSAISIEEAERKIVFASQISELAAMTGSLAHEINNPLTVVRMNIEILESEVEKVGRIQQRIELINKSLDRIQDITRSLLAYSRDSRSDSPVTVSLADIVRDALPFCQNNILKHKVLLKIGEFDPLISLVCRPVEISQIILNLLNNAVDAVADLTERWINLSVSQNVHDIEISISDSGSGIPEKMQAQIFQPFFTTKKLNSGTGLGLGICRSIAEKYGGSLNIDNSCENTRFILKLPNLALPKVSNG